MDPLEQITQYIQNRLGDNMETPMEAEELRAILHEYSPKAARLFDRLGASYVENARGERTPTNQALTNMTHSSFGFNEGIDQILGTDITLLSRLQANHLRQLFDKDNDGILSGAELYSAVLSNLNDEVPAPPAPAEDGQETEGHAESAIPLSTLPPLSARDMVCAADSIDMVVSTSNTLLDYVHDIGNMSEMPANKLPLFSQKEVYVFFQFQMLESLAIQNAMDTANPSSNGVASIDTASYIQSTFGSEAPELQSLQYIEDNYGRTSFDQARVDALRTEDIKNLLEFLPSSERTRSIPTPPHRHRPYRSPSQYNEFQEYLLEIGVDEVQVHSLDAQRLMIFSQTVALDHTMRKLTAGIGSAASPLAEILPDSISAEELATACATIEAEGIDESLVLASPRDVLAPPVKGLVDMLLPAPPAPTPEPQSGGPTVPPSGVPFP